jgi:hypothetical protein
LDGHDGDHLSADQRAWATAYEDKSTIDLTGRRPTAFPLEEQFTGPSDAPAGTLEAQIDSAMQAISLLQVQLVILKRACRAASPLDAVGMTVA